MARLNKTLVVRHPDTFAATALLEGEELPDWAADLVHEDDLDGDKPEKVADQTEDDDTEDEESEESDGDSTETVSPWAKTGKAELLDEVEKRNADREDDAKITPASNKVADLRAALDADDAAGE